MMKLYEFQKERLNNSKILKKVEHLRKKEIEKKCIYLNKEV